MEQHITNLILEMIGEDKLPDYNNHCDICAVGRKSSQDEGYNDALENIRDKVQDLVIKIMNLIKDNYGI